MGASFCSLGFDNSVGITDIVSISKGGEKAVKKKAEEQSSGKVGA
jgi:hypothetical protein